MTKNVKSEEMPFQLGISQAKAFFGLDDNHKGALKSEWLEIQHRVGADYSFQQYLVDVSEGNPLDTQFLSDYCEAIEGNS